MTTHSWRDISATLWDGFRDRLRSWKACSETFTRKDYLRSGYVLPEKAATRVIICMHLVLLVPSVSFPALLPSLACLPQVDFTRHH